LYKPIPRIDVSDERRVMEEHLPQRPKWDCVTCGAPWPCANAKSDLLQEYLGSRTSLLLYLGLRHWEAFDDYAATGVIPTDLDERFFDWVR
jgi:hypothetical protein